MSLAVGCGRFEIVMTRDMALDKAQRYPWHQPLMPSWNPLTQAFQFNFIGLFLTTWTLRLLEVSRPSHPILAPPTMTH